MMIIINVENLNRKTVDELFISLYLQVYISFYLQVFISFYLQVFISFYLQVFISFYLQVYISFYLQVYNHHYSLYIESILAYIYLEILTIIYYYYSIPAHFDKNAR